MSRAAKTIFSHGAIYAIGVILRNISSLIMLPIYTQHLKPSDYGVIELLGMVVDFVGIFIALQIGQAVFRYYSLAETETDKKKIINSAILMMVVMNVIGVLLVSGFAPVISRMMFDGAGFERLIRLFSLTMLFAAMSEVPMILIRAQQRPWLFVSASAFKLVMQISFNIWFVVINSMGVEGVVYSSLLTGVIFSSVLYVYAVFHTGFAFSASTMKMLATFSFPLLLGSMASFYMTSVDKYLLKHFSDLANVGLYSLAYKFGFLITAGIGMPFVSVWEPMRFSIYKEEGAQQQFANVFRLYTLVLAFVWLGISMFAEELLKIMSAHEFWTASSIVPWMVMAYMFHCWTEFSNFGIMLSGKTFHVARASVCGGVTMTVMCLLLVPRFGALGASMSASAAFFARFLWIYLMGQKYYPVKHLWSYCLSYLGFAIVLYVVSLASSDDVVSAMIEKAGLLVVYALVVWLSPLATSDDKDFVRGTVSRIVNLIPVFR
jgi:O-antigen/teichoic acid export membrane protein